MANTLRIKRRAATGAAGAPTTLAAAELAYNEKDDTLYYGFGDNGSGLATIIKPIAGAGYTGGGGGGVKFTASATAPSTPAAGDEWYNLNTGVLSTYVNDGTSSQWVQIAPATGTQGEIGPQGIQGTQGPQGIQGPQGVAGGGPAFGFRASKGGTAQSGVVTGLATFTKVTFATEEYDQGPNYDPALSRWTPPAGMVHIDASIMSSTGTSANIQFNLYIYKNGVVLKRGVGMLGATNFSRAHINVEDVANGSDYYEVFTAHNATGNLTLDGDATFTYFEGHVVSAQGPQGAAGAPGPAAPTGAVAPTGFRAHKNGVVQTGLSGTPIKITFGTEDYDQGGYYDTVNSRWTPPAGIIHIDGHAWFQSMTAGTSFGLHVYKNGVILKNQWMVSATATDAGIVNIDDVANGTDYYELFATASAGSIYGDALYTYFCGHVTGGPAGPTGPSGGPGSIAGIPSLNSAYSIVVGDANKVFRVTGTWTLSHTVTAATAGVGFAYWIKNDGLGTITIDPAGSETIDGSTTLLCLAKQQFQVVSDGANWFTIGRESVVLIAQSLNASAVAVADFAMPPDYKSFQAVAHNIIFNNVQGMAMRIASDGVPNFIASGNYFSNFVYGAGASAAANSQLNVTLAQLTIGSNIASQPIQFDVTFNNPSNAQFQWMSQARSWLDGSGAQFVHIFHGVTNLLITPRITHVRFLPSTGAGTMSWDTLNIYGRV